MLHRPPCPGERTLNMPPTAPKAFTTITLHDALENDRLLKSWDSLVPSTVTSFYSSPSYHKIKPGYPASEAFVSYDSAAMPTAVIPSFRLEPVDNPQLNLATLVREQNER